MADYTELQKRCQRGSTNLADANNLLAECYGALGALIAENERLVGSHQQVCENYNKVSYASEEREKQIDQLKAENEALRKSLSEAADEIESWGAYASEYFQQKHDLAGSVSRARGAATGQGGQSHG